MHTYHLVITEPSNDHYQDKIQTETSVCLYHVNLYKDPSTNNTIWNVQHSQKPAPRVLQPSSYFKEKLHFLGKFLFQKSDLIDSGYFQLSKNLVGNKNCYATHCNEVGKNSTPFRTRIKFDDEQQTQRRNILPIQFRKELKILLVDLQKNWIK